MFWKIEIRIESYQQLSCKPVSAQRESKGTGIDILVTKRILNLQTEQFSLFSSNNFTHSHCPWVATQYLCGQNKCSFLKSYKDLSSELSSTLTSSFSIIQHQHRDSAQRTRWCWSIKCFCKWGVFTLHHDWVDLLTKVLMWYETKLWTE